MHPRDVLRPAINPLGPCPNRTHTRSPGCNSVRPDRRRVSVCTKISAVPSPRVRNPKPRARLNHLTCARSNGPVGLTTTWVQAGGISAACLAVDVSIDLEYGPPAIRGRFVQPRQPPAPSHQGVAIRSFVAVHHLMNGTAEREVTRPSEAPQRSRPVWLAAMTR